MVAVQEEAKYQRTAGVDFGPVDVVKYAEAFGDKGLMIDSPDQIAPTLRQAFETPTPVLIGIGVDYNDNHKLFEQVQEQYHMIWVTKYRYKVLGGEIAVRTRDLLRQICQGRDVVIVQGSVSPDHIHMLVSVLPSWLPRSWCNT